MLKIVLLSLNQQRRFSDSACFIRKYPYEAGTVLEQDIGKKVTVSSEIRA